MGAKATAKAGTRRRSKLKGSRVQRNVKSKGVPGPRAKGNVKVRGEGLAISERRLLIGKAEAGVVGRGKEKATAKGVQGPLLTGIRRPGESGVLADQLAHPG